MGSRNATPAIRSRLEELLEPLLALEFVYRAYTWWFGFRTVKPLPPVTVTSGVLESQAQVEVALEQIRALGLRPHSEETKNWDSLAAVSLILHELGTVCRILDAGGTLYSRVLPWLFQFGFRDLVAINLACDRIRKRVPIRYLPGDLARTTFPSASFDAVACLSVIEHGVDVRAYLEEMARLIRPGGLLITSTDYWKSGVYTEGKEAYGQPIHIFDRAEIIELIATASEKGFELIGEQNLECVDRVVRWSPVEDAYTFVIVALRRGSDTHGQ